ncbi:hypothetical protein CHGG_04756 [Chaetomium globosum CBS 148.51]|uniref:Uncharacterized protein n=1 Tax=Chaetomium globosum (strain ATCC 6205 / CBS 148.51 / DSM 1962 / NBRC 6347 / NRRL 1970) TaxID=306901 RepID=Q2H0E0_CHAGB|nr:uncharacterized protein CHGG_04756 [Chaetomium globosum CBS 148.51]EAQ88137.1 hypothetical protein CHGG_04756 [Chaetomium globosum CBS 148.51]
MSMFSMIKRGRQAAKEHRAEQAKKEKEEAQKPPYKHVPKHAAIDAMSGGPGGWRENDRAKIVEQNRRRSAMTASGVGMSGMITPVHAGMPRVHSSLSHVSYPSAYASPVVQLPRGYSYSSMPAGWTPHGREMTYSLIDAGSISPKGKEVERIVDSSRTSRSSSKMSTGRTPLPPAGTLGVRDAAPSPVESSGGSTSSQDDLEMKPVDRHSVPIPPPTSVVANIPKPSRPTSDTESIHRLHPGRSRRISDPNQSVSRSPHAPRTSSLAQGVPPVPALPPMQFGTAITTPEVFSSAASSASSVTMVPVASSASLSTKTATVPTVLKVEGLAAPQYAEIGRAESTSEEKTAIVKTPTEIPAAPTAASDSPTKKGRRTSKMTRFTELEPIQSNTTVATEPSPKPTAEPKKVREEKDRPVVNVAALPTSFDEAAFAAPKEIAVPATAPSSKPGKLSKSPAPSGKLVKKNRWSLRSSKSTAVAV